MNFSKLDRVFQISKSVLRGCESIPTVSNPHLSTQLEKIMGGTDPFPEWVVCGLYSVSAFTSAILFFHGSWYDAAISGVLALVPGGLRLVAGRYKSFWVSTNTVYMIMLH